MAAFTILTRLCTPRTARIATKEGKSERIASTIRHNRARGKHQVDLMSILVKKLFLQGWTDIQIAKHLGMENEEIFRLRQQVRCAEVLANKEYSKAWEIPQPKE